MMWQRICTLLARSGAHTHNHMNLPHTPTPANLAPFFFFFFGVSVFEYSHPLGRVLEILKACPELRVIKRRVPELRVIKRRRSNLISQIQLYHDARSIFCTGLNQTKWCLCGWLAGEKKTKGK